MMPGQALITKDQALIFSSENVSMKPHDNEGWCRKIMQKIWRTDGAVNRELINNSNVIGYAGLQLLKGKILVLDNMLPETANMLIKAKYVIAHTPNVELKWATEARRQERNNNNNQEGGVIPNLDGFRDELTYAKMSQIKSKNSSLPDKKKIGDSIKKIINEGKTMSSLYASGLPMYRELIFVQSQSNFIEKNLGQGEQIKIRTECLVAHAPTVHVTKSGFGDLDFNPRGHAYIFNSKNKFLTLRGPGLVYIDMQAGNRFFKEVQLSLFLVILYCLLYLLMFAIVTLDKLDMLGAATDDQPKPRETRLPGGDFMNLN